MHDDIEIDRDAIAEVHRMQNQAALDAAIERGEWTPQEAGLIHAAFMRSDILQKLVTRDIEHLEAFMAGRVH